MTLVRHITRPHHVEAILKSGELLQELCHSGTANLHYWDKQLQKAQGGRLLWLTEEGFASNSQQPGVEHRAFHFDAENTPGLYRWEYVRLAGMNKGKKEEAAILNMEITAKAHGDNPMKWWVAKKPVSLKHCINLDNLELCVGRTDLTANQIVANTKQLVSQVTNPTLKQVYEQQGGLNEAGLLNYLNTLGYRIEEEA